MSASADNGAARETFSSSFGEQRSSVGTNTNGSSTSTSTQTSQPGVRTRIIVDDFIALISNVPAASMAAAAAAAQGQIPPGMTGAQNLAAQGQGAATATATTTSQPQPQPQTQSVPTPAAQNATPGQEQARPPGLPAGLSMNLLSGMPTPIQITQTHLCLASHFILGHRVSVVSHSRPASSRPNPLPVLLILPVLRLRLQLPAHLRVKLQLGRKVSRLPTLLTHHLHRRGGQDHHQIKEEEVE